MTPDEYTPERAKLVKRWKRNRDHTDGTDTVKEAGKLYLDKPKRMQDCDYEGFVTSVTYFPASARTLQSFLGLVFRKAPIFNAPPAIKAVEHVITASGDTLEELARRVFREYAITNDGGLLTDYPATPSDLTKAQASELDLRAYQSLYVAESIRELTYGVIGGMKRLINVRLLDDEDTVRQLQIIDGVYTVTIHKRIDNNWIVESVTVPQANGSPLKHIPFVSLNDGDTGSSFDDLCAHNHTHYQISGLIRATQQWITGPVRVIAGVTEEAEIKKLEAAGGALWVFNEPEVKWGFFEFEGKGLPELRLSLEALEDNMAQVGSRMLTSEKAAAEAEGTVARRQASENSILASMARHVGSRMQGSARNQAVWEGLNPDLVTFELSTDFIPTPIDPQLLAQIAALHNANKITDRDLFTLLQNGEIISETVTFEQHQDELETQAEPIIPYDLQDQDNDPSVDDGLDG